MKEIKTYNELTIALAKAIEKRELIDTSRIERGIGKSQLLFDVASKTDCYIIVPTVTVAGMFNYRFKTNIYHTPKSLRGRDKELFVFLEEGLDSEMERYCFKTFTVLSGYTSNTKEKEIEKIRLNFEMSTKRLEEYCKEINDVEKHLKSLKRVVDIEKEYQDTLYKMLALWDFK